MDNDHLARAEEKRQFVEAYEMVGLYIKEAENASRRSAALDLREEMRETIRGWPDGADYLSKLKK